MRVKMNRKNILTNIYRNREEERERESDKYI